MSGKRFLYIHTGDGRNVTLPLPRKSISLANAIWLSGEIPALPLCAGLGRCGMCRIRFLSRPPEAGEDEKAILGANALAKGWRLACRHIAEAGMDVTLSSETGLERKQKTVISSLDNDGKNNDLLLAVDLGTTFIQWRLFPSAYGGAIQGDAAPGTAMEQEEYLLTGRVLNPQIGAGTDVISRIATALTSEGRSLLRNPVLHLLQEIVRNAPGVVREICVAGNTAMTAILLDADVDGLAAAPYTLREKGGRTIALPDLPPVWIPPQPAPFVGGDVSAGMAVLLWEHKEEFPFLLADLGTNGEFVLAMNERKSFVASVPLGPSLEGIGLSHGGVVGPGSVTAFRLGPAGLYAVAPNDGLPEKICGTGYLSLLDSLLRCGFMSPDGKPAASPPTPLARKLQTMLRYPAGIWELPLSGRLSLSGTDVEELLKVKAAFSLALEQLFAVAGLRSGDVARFILSGALGENAPVQTLENLGFLPQGAEGRTVAAGNTSLAGAALLLKQPELRVRLRAWSDSCKVLSLVDQPTFMEHYIRHMAWGWL